MSVTIYGASDDLIEVEGDIREEYQGGREGGDVLVCSDGTVLRLTYGEDPADEDGIWRIAVVQTGTAELNIERSTGEDGYTDRAVLAGQIEWVLHEDAFALGEVAYSGYFVACKGKSNADTYLPSWDEQSVQIRAAWVAAAEAVRAKVDG